MPYAMPLTVTLTAYFRPDAAADPLIGPERYVAGFEDADGEPWGISVPLEPDEVDSAVLGTISFSISMELDGTLLIEAEGRGDAANEAIAKRSHLARLPLDDIVRAALDADLMAMEDDAEAALGTLRGRLLEALELVDRALSEEET